MRFLRSTGRTTGLAAFVCGLVLLTGLTAVVVSDSGDVVGAGPPGLPTPTPGSVAPGSNHDGLAKATTREEADRLLATAYAEGRITTTRGTTTAGTTVEIANRQIKLPSDAFIAERSFGSSCKDPDYCPASPAYKLSRWNSTIWVGSDGLVFGETLAKGEENAFDFLVVALR